MKGELRTFWCNKCGAANGPQNLLCVGCAERLQPSYMAGPTGETCPTCGTQNSFGVGFCRSCGTPLPQSQEQRQSVSSPPPAQPPAGGSRLSRLAQARLAKEQSQPKTQESSSSDWLSGLRSDAAAVPIPENDEDEDAPVMSEFIDTDQPRSSSSSGAMDFDALRSSMSDTSDSDALRSSLFDSSASYGGATDFDQLRSSTADSSDSDSLRSSLFDPSASYDKPFDATDFGQARPSASDSGDSLRSSLFESNGFEDLRASLNEPETPDTSAPTSFSSYFDQVLSESDANPLFNFSDPATSAGTNSANSLEGLRSQPQTGPLFAPDSLEGSLFEDEPPVAVPLFDNNEITNPPFAAPEPPTESDFDPRRSSTGYLPDWLRELNPDSSSGSASSPSETSATPPAQFGVSPSPFQTGTNEAEEGASGLMPFELNESKTIDGGRDVRVPTSEEMGGVPDWLRDISSGPSQPPIVPDSEKPEWLSELESQRTTKPKLEGDMPDWLRDISAQSGPKASGRPTFGDDEVAATLEFAFGDNSDKPAYGDLDALPNLNVPPDFAKNLPPEALRTGMTGELPDFLREVPKEPLGEVELPPLPILDMDSMFVEETEQGEQIPFSLPPLPDFEEMAAEEASPQSSAPWGNGLPPWLRGLELPTFEADGAGSPLSFPIIGIPEEAYTPIGFEEEEMATAAGNFPVAESDVAALFDETDLPNPESPVTQDLMAASKTDGSTRAKESRPFSLRDVMHQTDTLAGNMRYLEEAEARQSAQDAESYTENAPPENSAFSMDEFNALRSSQSYDTPRQEEVVPFESAFASAEPETADVPDWLRDQLPTAEPSEPETADVPDWLRGQLNAEENRQATEQIPDWLRSQESQATQPTIEFAMPPLEDAPDNEATSQDTLPFELPSFDFGEPEPATPAPPQASTAPTQPLYVPPLPRFDEEEEEQAELMPFDPAQFSEPAFMPANSSGLPASTINFGGTQEEDLPDWLKSDDAGAAPMSFGSAPAASAPAFPPAADDTVPSWLQNMEAATQPAPPSSASSPPPSMPLPTSAEAPGTAAGTDEEMPPWLQAMVTNQPSAAPVPNKPESRYSSMFSGISRAEEQQADLPEWLKDSAELAPANAAEAGSSTSSADAAEVDRLLAGFNSAEQAEENAPAPIPDWLRGQQAGPVPEFEMPEDLPEWLKADAAAAESEGELPIKTDRSMSFDTAPGDANGQSAMALPTNSFSPATSPSEDLLGGGFFSDSDAPSWMRGPTTAAPETAIPSAVPLPPTPGFEMTTGVAATPSLPGWLGTVGRATIEPETANALYEPLTAPGSMPQVNLPAHLASADVLAALLAAETVATTTQAPPAAMPGEEVLPPPQVGPGMPRLLTYLLYGLLILVTIFALLQPLAQAPLTVTPVVRSFYDTLDSLKPNDKVLIAYDWEGDRSGEMRPMAQAVTQQIMKHRARIVAVSLNPQGPALASQITDEVATAPDYGNNATGLYQYGIGYLNLGWRPGNEAALRSFFTNLGSISDYRNGTRASTYQVMQGINSINDFDAVVVLTGDEGSVRSWIEQFGVQPQARLLFGTTAAVAPMARPYLFTPPSAQPNISSNYPRALGLLEGLNGTAQYQQILKDNGIKTDSKVNLDERLTAQSFAILFLILTVIVANIVYFVRRRE